MKIFFHTLGCKVNQYETQEMREEAEKNGYTLTENEDEADIFVINSCTVTGEGDRKTRQCVRHFKAPHQNCTKKVKNFTARELRILRKEQEQLSKLRTAVTGFAHTALFRKLADGFAHGILKA